MTPPVWAFQVENFEPPPHDELICSICQCVFCEPVECPCRHVFCSACIGKWIVMHRNCPICRKRISESTLRPVNRIIKNLIMGLTLRCKNVNFGCEIRVTLEVCEAHMKACLYELEECANGCGKLVFRKDVVKHKQEECPCRRIECIECGMNIAGCPGDHNCITALQLALHEKQKENNELKEQLKVLKEKLDEKAKDTNMFNTTFSSFDIDSLWSSCTSDSDSISSLDHQEMPSVSYSTTSISSSDTDSLESSPIVTLTDSVIQNEDDPENSDLNISINEVNSPPPSLESVIADILMESSPVAGSSTAGPSGSSGEESLNSRRPMKRRLRPDLFLGSESENMNEQSAGSRKAQRSNSSDSALATNSSPSFLIERSDQNSSFEFGPIASVASTSFSNGSPSRQRKSDPWQRTHASSEFNSTVDLASPTTPEETSNIADTSVVNEEHSNQSVVKIFRRTLSLLRQHNLESDPEWVPGSVSDSDSENMQPLEVASSSSSESEHEAIRALSSSSDEPNEPASDTDTTSFEVAIPTYELLQRYCEFDSDCDSEWTP